MFAAILSLPRDPARPGHPSRIELRDAPHTRYFIFGGPVLRFGRAKPGGTGENENHLILRVLPCRSQQQDAKNFLLTNEISGKHAQLFDVQLSMAAERTLLAWIRTGLAMMGFGFVVARFGLFLREIAATRKTPPAPSIHLSVWLGTALVAVGVYAFIASAIGHIRFLRRLERGVIEPEPRGPLGVMIGIVLAALGIAMVAYLVLLALSG